MFPRITRNSLARFLPRVPKFHDICLLNVTYLSKAAIPGKTFPSSHSKKAPPAVEV